MADTLPFADVMADSILKNTQSAPTASAMTDSILKNTDPNNTPGPLSGKFVDYALSVAPVGRILGDFGEGAANAWGTSPLGAEANESLQKEGYFNDPKNKKKSILKSINETWIRPLLPPIDLAERAVSSTFGGVSNVALRQSDEILQEAQKLKESDDNNPTLNSWSPSRALPSLVAIPGETLAAFAHGILPSVSLHEVAASARSKGLIGEGEKGVYNTIPVSPENLQARAEAAERAGIPVPPVKPVVTDSHVVARRIAPDTLQEWDEKLAYHDVLTKRLEELRETHLAPDFFMKPSPEYKQAQEAFVENYNRLKELEPLVQDAYDHARDLLPPPEAPVETPVSEEGSETQEEAATASEKPVQGTPADQATLGATEEGASPEASQAVSEDRLRVARKMPDGEVIVGKPGEMHSDLISDTEMDRKAVGHVGILESDMGFATPDGKYLDRQQAMEWVKEHHQGINQDTIGGGPRDKDKLEAVGYEKELDLARLKEDASSKLPPHLEEVKGTGKTKILGLARHINESAIEKGLTEGFGDLPEYNQVNMKDQAGKAAEILARDPQEALDIALGKKAPPVDVLPESVLVAVENDATERGDVETLRQLATNSYLSVEAKTMGQRLRTLAERDPYSALSAMKAVRDAWDTRLGNSHGFFKTVAGMSKDMNESIGKYILSKDDLQSFIKSIECDY